jgi:hypothetical protein
VIKHSRYKHFKETANASSSARRSDAEAANALPDQTQLAAEFQIMDAGCSVKL